MLTVHRSVSPATSAPTSTAGPAAFAPSPAPCIRGDSAPPQSVSMGPVGLRITTRRSAPASSHAYGSANAGLSLGGRR